MTKMQMVIKRFEDHDNAYECMIKLNKLSKATGRKDIHCIVNGPDNDFVVCDLDTAIELELPYEWAF